MHASQCMFGWISKLITWVMWVMRAEEPRAVRFAVQHGLARFAVQRGFARFDVPVRGGLRIEDLGTVTGSLATTGSAGSCRFEPGTLKYGLNGGSVRFVPSQTARMATSSSNTLS